MEGEGAEIDSPYAMDTAMQKQSRDALLMRGVDDTVAGYGAGAYDSGNTTGGSDVSPDADLLSKPISGVDGSQNYLISTQGHQKSVVSQNAYNIDLFSGEEAKNTPDKDMQDDTNNKKKPSVKKESSSASNDSSGTSNSNSGSDSSDNDDDNDNSDDDMQDDNAASSTQKRQNIEVPASVIQRFFSNKEVLMNFLANINEETTHKMLEVS